MDTQEKNSPQEIGKALFQQAVELWGHERAAGLRAILDQTAEHLWNLSRNAPGEEVEPAFFL